MMAKPADLAIARQLWDYLRLGQPVQPADWILVFGGHDLGVADRAADLFHAGCARRILVSGGALHVPDDSSSQTEADAIADVLIRSDVPADAVEIERLAANTSENFWLSAELLRDLGEDPQEFLVVQKPYAERRTLATARRRWPPKSVRLTSQDISFEQYLAGSIPVPRVLSMIAGEIIRLDSYGRSGLIQPDAPVPTRLVDDARRLRDAGFDGRAVTSSPVAALNLAQR